MSGARTGTATRAGTRTPAETGTVPLGRIAGVTVSAHWSVLGIVALIAVVMARVELPLLAPGHGATAYAVAGLAVALVLMASLLAHEVAHALVARRNGVEVEGITLWLLGGVARLRGGARTPGAEFRIAGVGPLTSLVLGVLLGAGAMLARLAGADGLPVAVSDRLDRSTADQLAKPHEPPPVSPPALVQWPAT